MDAGVVVELIVGNLDPDLLGDEELAAPHLIDSEVTHVYVASSAVAASAMSKGPWPWMGSPG